MTFQRVIADFEKVLKSIFYVKEVLYKLGLGARFFEEIKNGREVF